LFATLAVVAAFACSRAPVAVVDAYSLRAQRARSYPKPAGPPGKRSYAAHFAVPATVFWVGEPATTENGCMPNLASAFDHDWIGAYGGCDAADPRVVENDGWNRPAGFVPRENPYYVALPYGTNELAPWRLEVPWLTDRPDVDSVRRAVKNRWVAIRRGARTCYAQWEDVGPFYVDDVAYVFGDARPKNDGKSSDPIAGIDSTGAASGIDLSPATATCLGATYELGIFDVDWWFVDDASVPDGPWRRVVTTSPVRDPPVDSPARSPSSCVRNAPFPTCGG
jgi:hypothetical protein